MLPVSKAIKLQVIETLKRQGEIRFREDAFRPAFQAAAHQNKLYFTSERERYINAMTEVRKSVRNYFWRKLRKEAQLQVPVHAKPSSEGTRWTPSQLPQPPKPGRTFAPKAWSDPAVQAAAKKRLPDY